MITYIKQHPNGIIDFVQDGVALSIGPGHDVRVMPKEVQDLAATWTQEQIDAYRGPQRTPAELLALRIEAVKSETTRRIDAAAAPHTRENMIGAAAAGVLTASQQAAYAASVQWIADMRAACQALIADSTADYRADANWPPLPPEVAALAAQF
ncbi:hypothetical protein [Actibacterium sp. MT2.3-13A]|uniref:hypothetical protein n=1 Tax=Actibacterium sp. MT2.3-13A TaxID=2828332 RepID=UPI001BA8D53C|nr:hypothetical protein [Actibacterium sp. MT2.3-13A]